MKTRISIPDKLFAAAEAVSQGLGMSRNEFYAKAVAAFVDTHQMAPALTVTDLLNEVYADESPLLDPVLAQMQSASIARRAWWSNAPLHRAATSANSRTSSGKFPAASKGRSRGSVKISKSGRERASSR